MAHVDALGVQEVDIAGQFEALENAEACFFVARDEEYRDALIGEAGKAGGHGRTLFLGRHLRLEEISRDDEGLHLAFDRQGNDLVKNANDFSSAQGSAVGGKRRESPIQVKVCCMQHPDQGPAPYRPEWFHS